MLMFRESFLSHNSQAENVIAKVNNRHVISGTIYLQNLIKDAFTF